METTVLRMDKLEGLKERITRRIENKMGALKDARGKGEKLRRLLELRSKVSERLVFYSREEDRHLLELIDHSIHELALS